jgi:hypothetical protein
VHEVWPRQRRCCHTPWTLDHCYCCCCYCCFLPACLLLLLLLLLLQAVLCVAVVATYLAGAEARTTLPGEWGGQASRLGMGFWVEGVTAAQHMQLAILLLMTALRRHSSSQHFRSCQQLEVPKHGNCTLLATSTHQLVTNAT